MKLLLVEDEEKSAKFVRDGLIESGYLVDVAYHGDEGIRLAKSNAYSLIILDVLLPGRDGWSILTELRQSGHSTPVLVLSAIGDTNDRVRGLNLGADDYICKPFSFTELLARIRSVLRRRPVSAPDILSVGDLVLDVTRHRAFRGTRRLELTPKEFSMLAFLMRRTGEVVTRRVICELVWQMHFDPGTNVVDVHIRRLRSKVDDLSEVKLVHTVRGMGYVVEVREQVAD